MTDREIELENENIEVELLIEALVKKHGFDFRDYSRVHIKRRILEVKQRLRYESISMMIKDIIYDREFLNKLLLSFSINYTEMFRDPDVYLFMRNEIIDLLRTFPFVKIWHAGCSTGEEVYSLAIMLKEAGIYNKTQIYATDFNDKVLKMAEDGIYPIEYVKNYTSNYQQAGGKESFSDYYIADDNNVIMDSSLRKKVVFANHNLVTDGVFGEIHLIMCRNVLIYFNKNLQDRVLHLFKDSLCNGGVLCLGTKETIENSTAESDFETLDKKLKIYRLKY
ncbi:MAG: chemotaxis protein CheR [Denitrovibrio sp.]|nr:MAG: chemotaxis protein CheR [Denitrovibrio sp.]